MTHTPITKVWKHSWSQIANAMAKQHTIFNLLVLWMIFGAGLTDGTTTPTTLTPTTPTTTTPKPTTPTTTMTATTTTTTPTTTTTTTTDPKCVGHDCGRDHGSCHADGGNPACTCIEGYKGANCETATACLSNPCQNGGTCSSSNATYHYCTCPNGYTQPDCKTDTAGTGSNGQVSASTTTMDPRCVSYNCSGDHGSCHIVANNAACSCKEGYNGTACEKKTACHTQPCMHGGTCSSNNATYRYCTCTEGFGQPDCNAGTTLMMTFTVLLLSVVSKFLLS